MKTILPLFSNAQSSMLAAITTFDGLKSAMGNVIGLLMLFCFLVAIVIFIAGILQKDNDPAAAARAMKTAAWLAAAPVVVTILFAIFGNSGASVAPNFN